MSGSLASWRDGPAREALVEFVDRTVSNAVPVDERVAVFDNDGTLWCEKPMPIQLDFILRRLVAMADAKPELQKRQPWKAAFERDYGWFGKVMADHYAGDDTNVRTLAGGILAAYEGISVEDFESEADAFLRSAQHPTLARRYLQTAYAPMVELLGFLEANGFSNYIASGGGRDFMRPISHEVYGVPRERVIGSASTFEYTRDEHGGTIRDIPMLDFTQHTDKASLRLLVLHDDAEREFDYTSGAEQALEQADTSGWTVVSVKNDWATVF
ncbi:MAG: haloacid dehalogenase-like hydrolase [Actinobacteria bacterium]|nr:MAG: haloacid dehalogenase-like hydrolase [Actinomycetota bacterium]